MILVRTPFRVSFIGGGSDFYNFYRYTPGAVISTSIDKYMYISINKKFDGKIRINYSTTEEVAHNEDVKHPLVRESLILSGI
jgi:D-glycero-alpha-D-manno-heptose-7-phosphate kinase